MSSFEEEIDEITAQNAEMTGVVLNSGLVGVEDLNRCHRIIDKLRLRGERPLPLLDCLEEQKVIQPKARVALEKAYDRSKRDRESSAYQIPGYQVIRKIGSGGLGDVLLARQVSMKRLVALKVLHDKWGRDEEFRSRFLLEARVQGRLSHQHLVQVYDVGRQDKHYYFSMEYVDGSTLDRVIREEGALDLPRALEISVQTARAIDYISTYDIVHRDVKPANIMINQNGVVKLGDFGFLLTKHEHHMESEGYVIGTPDYISPEQASGLAVDFRSDIYSLGVCLYQMLTGQLPYEGTVSAVMLKHVTGDLPERNLVGGSLIPPDIYSLICKMMAKNPDDRYSSTRQLIDDLQYYEASERLKAEGRWKEEVSFQPLPSPSVRQPPVIQGVPTEAFDAVCRQLKWQMLAIVLLAVLLVFETLYLALK